MRGDESLRAPPHSIEAEQAVLGGLMLQPEALAKVADWLSESDFFRRDHQAIYRAISELARRGDPCDAVTLGEWLRANGIADLVGGVGYVIEVANNTPSAANIVAYAEIVAEKAKLRALIEQGTAIASAAFAKGASASDIAAKAAHELTGITSARSSTGLAPVKPIMKALFAEMHERYQRGPALLGLPTPWKDINDITKGLRPGCLYIIGARPSMGKSIFGGNVACFSALRGERVALFSPEMTAQEYMARAIAAHGDIPFEWVEQPNDTDEDSELYWQRQTRVIAELNSSDLLIDDTPSIRIEQVMARARREHLRKPIRLVVGDHLHDHHTDPRAERRHELARITQGYKTLAKELNCPAILFAQLNRNVSGRADKRPTLTDLRECGEIEQKGDVIAFLHREDYYDPNTHLKGVIEFIPAKGRNIRIGDSAHLRNRFDRMRMDDWEGALPEADEPPPRRGFSRGFRRGVRDVAGDNE